MPTAYSDDLRARVLALYDDGMDTNPIAKLLRVSPAWARRVRQRRDDVGPPRPPGGSRPRLNAAARAKLDQWVAERPDATLAELRDRAAAELGVTVSVGCLFATLRALRLTYKKSRSSPPGRPARTWRRPGRRSSPSSWTGSRWPTSS